MTEYKPFQPVDYPTTLEAKYWDKKKSLRAKAAGATGIGDALKDAQAAYKKVDWDTLDLGAHFHGNNFNVKVWKSSLDLAVAEARHGLLAFVRTLEEVNKVALKAVKTFKEKKYADDVKLADSIAGEAEVLAAKLHWNVVVPVLIAEHNDSLQKFQTVVDNLKHQLKLALADSIQAVKDMKKEPTAAVFGKKQTVTRKITQVVGNVERYIKMGFDVALDVGPAKKLFNDLTPYANGQVELPKEAGEEEVNKAIDTLVEILKRVKPLTE